MLRIGAIQSKALMLLVVFAANFFVVCHCQASMRAAHSHLVHSCCEHVASHKGMGEKPCDGKDGCQHTKAIRFQLLEKQVADPVTQPPVFVSVLDYSHILFQAAVPERAQCQNVLAERWRSAYSPPDLQVLYQSFLI